MSKIKSSSLASGRRSKLQEVKFKRVPLRKNDLASYVSMQARGEYLEHPMSDMFCDILHEMVVKMVYSVCHKYSRVRHSRTVDDLAQNCWLKIMRYIPRFERKKSSFSTYCYRICSSACKDACRLIQRKPIYFSPTAGETEPNFSEPQQPALFDIKLATLTAIKKFRRYKKVTIALLGDPRESDYQCPADIDLNHAAKMSGRAYRIVKLFYTRKLRPLLMAELRTERGSGHGRKRYSTGRVLSEV